jgi:hypothetical protein
MLAEAEGVELVLVVEQAMLLLELEDLAGVELVVMADQVHQDLQILVEVEEVLAAQLVALTVVKESLYYDTNFNKELL